LEGLECHGTGTALGDPIEVGALLQVLAPHQSSQPLNLGAAKTNIAHLEMSAGAVGFLKCILLLMQSRFGPNLHIRALNPYLHINRSRVSAVSRFSSMACIHATEASLFGFGSVNVYKALETASQVTNSIAAL
jgi:acyl transferase domain-containing protein